MIEIGLIGDLDESVPAHRAIPIALEMAAGSLGSRVNAEWIPTTAVESLDDLIRYHGLWCVPGSPYRSTDGAIRAIRYAREQGRPFLGTCGGFQHAVIEYARHVLGWRDAEHAETAPDAEALAIVPLQCALVEQAGHVRFRAGSLLQSAYGTDESTEGYSCSYGLNPTLEASLVAGPLHVTARDADGDVRGLELDGHPFFVLTLFQPERLALRGVLPPIVLAFVAASATHAAR
jgi:CTP synthase (UTP-ammonia lyase)